MIFYDTESTDLPPRGTAYTMTFQMPWVMELAAILVDDDWNEVEVMEELVQPTDSPAWRLNEKAFAAHGISRADCESKGKPIRDVMRSFHKMLKQAQRQGAYNIDFDLQLLQAEYVRLSVDPTIISRVPQHCIMKPCTDICKLPGKYPGSFKWPKLGEAFQHFFGRDMGKAHRALDDIRNALAVAKELHKLGLYPSPQGDIVKTSVA